jgi:hypothetical protein
VVLASRTRRAGQPSAGAATSVRILNISELAEPPDRFGHFDLALLPTNGLCVRPINNAQLVMDATEARNGRWPYRPDVSSPDLVTVVLAVGDEV